jgi:hypothetical protein
MITQELVNSVFEYRDGDLYFKKTISKKAKEGKKAGGIVPNGYISVSFLRHKTYAHRVIFLMHYGYLPEVIDHIDCNPLNNKIENLRAATKSQNGMNRGKQVNNSSGYKGVYFSKARKKWIAQIKINQKMKYLGGFVEKDDAHKCYLEASKDIHKEFARYV